MKGAGNARYERIYGGGGAPRKKPFRGKKIKVLHTDQKSDKMNIILGNMEVGMKKAFTLRNNWHSSSNDIACAYTAK